VIVLSRQGRDERQAATVSPVFCNQCGHRNPPGVNFCSSCGAPVVSAAETTLAFLPEDPSADLNDEELGAAIGDLAEGVGVLVVRRGPDAGAKYLLDNDVVRVGRHPESDIFLDDITVSRRHAEVVRDGRDYRVRDVGSLNGTYVNRDRIDDAELVSGDEVQVGKFKLVFLTARAR